MADFNGYCEKYLLRSDKYEVRSFNHEFIKLTCRYQLLTMLNNISNEHTILHSINDIQILTYNNFKHIVKSHFLSKYSNICTIVNCYSCQCSNPILIAEQA